MVDVQVFFVMLELKLDRFKLRQQLFKLIHFLISEAQNFNDSKNECDFADEEILSNNMLLDLQNKRFG